MEIVNLHDVNFDPLTMVIIDRKSIWGNPFKMTSESDRMEVIEKYVYYILDKPELLDKLDTLYYKTLACWCDPKPCHGEVLRYLACRPWIVARYRQGKITKKRIMLDIFKMNGWNAPKASKQVTLF